MSNSEMVERRHYDQVVGDLKTAITERDQHEKMNSALVGMLQESKQQIELLKEEVGQLTAPPNPYGTFISLNKDGTAEILSEGRRVRCNVAPDVDSSALEEGQMVLLNDAMCICEAVGYNTLSGEICTIKDLLIEDDECRILVSSRTDDEKVVVLAKPLRHEKLRVGDHLLCDIRSAYALEKMPKSEAEEVSLEEVPDVSYEQIGGLGDQIQVLRDTVELPYLYADLFKEHELKPPKGVLLYGPPGCGKTLIAKAVANALSKRIEEKTGKATPAYFLNVKGPELLNKYVGETEHKIREVFNKAREKAREDVPVVVFFDEMDSLFRMRGSGISSDMEATVVAQFLSEIDGVESLENVIVVGASNRQDLIDPAVLRPGRLDLKVKVQRPDREAAQEIFSKYMTANLPLHQTVLDKYEGDRKAACDSMIKDVIKNMYSEGDENKFLEVTYAKGEREIFFFKDFSSGAMIENIVARAKRKAVKRQIDTGEYGIRTDDLTGAVRDEFKENEDLPNTTNPDDWARISGRKGERIVNVRTLMEDATQLNEEVEDVGLGQGQYL